MANKFGLIYMFLKAWYLKYSYFEDKNRKICRHVRRFIHSFLNCSIQTHDKYHFIWNFLNLQEYSRKKNWKMATEVEKNQILIWKEHLHARHTMWQFLFIFIYLYSFFFCNLTFSINLFELSVPIRMQEIFFTYKIQYNILKKPFANIG